MYLILWLIAVALVIYGIVCIMRGAILLGVVLIIVGLLVGPGGVSIFDVDDDDDEDLRSGELTIDVCATLDGPQFACWLTGLGP